MSRHLARAAALLMLAALVVLPAAGSADETSEPEPTYELKVKMIGDELEFGAFNRIAACRVECIGDDPGDDSDDLEIGFSPDGAGGLPRGDAWVGSQASTTSGAMRGPVPPGDWRIAVDVEIDGERSIGYVTGQGPGYISSAFGDGLVIPVVDAPVTHPDIPITDVAPVEPKLPKMPGQVSLHDDDVLNDKFYFSEWKGVRLPEGAKVKATLRLCEGKKVVRRTVGENGKIAFDVEGSVPEMARRSSIRVVTSHPDYRNGVTVYGFVFDDKRYKPGC